MAGFCLKIDFSDDPSRDGLREVRANRVVLVVAAIAGVIFGDGLILMGLVGLGVITLPFVWPVALGVLVAAAIVAVVAYAALHSSKGEKIQMAAEISSNDGDDKDSSLDEASKTEEIQMSEIPSNDGDNPDSSLGGLDKELSRVQAFSKEGSESIGSFEDIKKAPAPSRLEWITERQQMFFDRALSAKKRFQADGQIDDNALKYFVLALSVFYSKSCHLKVSEDKPFDEYDYCQKLADNQPDLYIRTVCIDPQQGKLKYFRGVGGICTGNRVCLEPHASVYLSRNGKTWEYFDPKFIPLHDGLTETKGLDSVSLVKSLVKGEIAEYRNREGSPVQLQPDFNAIDCGIHVCRRIEQYFKTDESEFLSVLTEDQLREERERFALLINKYVIDAYSCPFDWQGLLEEKKKEWSLISKNLYSSLSEPEKMAVDRSLLFTFNDALYDKINHSSAASDE